MTKISDKFVIFLIFPDLRFHIFTSLIGDLMTSVLMTMSHHFLPQTGHMKSSYYISLYFPEAESTHAVKMGVISLHVVVKQHVVWPLFEDDGLNLNQLC